MDESADGDMTEGNGNVALRRQQLFVGSALAAIGGLAATIATGQQFPGYPIPLYLAAGMVTTGLLFAVLYFSIFRDGGS